MKKELSPPIIIASLAVILLIIVAVGYFLMRPKVEVSTATAAASGIGRLGKDKPNPHSLMSGGLAGAPGAPK